MKNILVLPAFLFLVLACGNLSQKSETDKPLTVDEIRAIQKDKPEDFKTKYLGKKIILVGKVVTLPYTYAGAYETFGYQNVLLSGNGDARPVNCQVTEAEGAKFKDVKADDVVTVTGTVKAGEFTMDLENCSKYALPK
jgi:hypothetical protein